MERSQSWWEEVVEGTAGIERASEVAEPTAERNRHQPRAQQQVSTNSHTCLRPSKRQQLGLQDAGPGNGILEVPAAAAHPQGAVSGEVSGHHVQHGCVCAHTTLRLAKGSYTVEQPSSLPCLQHSRHHQNQNELH